METEFSANSAANFWCDACDILCSKKNDWTRHLRTMKHARKSGNKIETGKSAPNFRCKCGKVYQTKSGLWKHGKICDYKPTKHYIKDEPLKQGPTDISSGNLDFLTNLVLEVVKNNADLQKQNNDYQKQNQELQKQMMDLCKNNTATTHFISNSHNNNKTFNMQFFLNEQCKDAMNIMDFVGSMTLEFADLEEVGKLGYVEGLGGIIIKKLNELDVHKRPIHCSDAKREIMYVKDENVWGKENSTYDKLRKAIKHVTFKNSSMLEPWSKAHPQCMNTSHHLNDVYVQMMGQAMGGKESFLDSENKIMKKIAKAVLIDKACS